MAITQVAGVSARTAEAGRSALNVYADDFAVVKGHLHTLELTWVRPVERIRIGTIATLEDSDGNHVNTLELLPDYLPAGRP